MVSDVRRPRCGLTSSRALTAGPDALCLRGDIDVHGEDFATVGTFDIHAGEQRALALTWFPSHMALPERMDPFEALRDTEAWWRDWSARCTYDGPWREEVRTSLRVLKTLTFGPTGGSSRPRPPRCPNGRVVRGTGITGTAGFATRR